MAATADMSRAARACAECRRLKHKCDRAIPCTNCVTRGCPELCPDGTNTTGEGNRRFWSRTLELRDKATMLAERIQQLEIALAQAHGRYTPTPHPLLAPALVQIKEPFLRPAGSPTAPMAGWAAPPAAAGPSMAGPSFVPPDMQGQMHPDVAYWMNSMGM